MEDLLKSAINNTMCENHMFLLNGDINQMSIQKQFLQSHGFDVKHNNVYPTLRKSDVKRALELIFEKRVAGWWHYDIYYTGYGICNSNEFTRLIYNTQT